jgi:serine/threonine protein kinase
MAKWLCQLLLALDYLQTQQVLHRDIKTSNLMLTAEDDVQLGDFGLATMMKEEGACCWGCAVLLCLGVLLLGVVCVPQGQHPTSTAQWLLSCCGCRQLVCLLLPTGVPTALQGTRASLRTTTLWARHTTCQWLQPTAPVPANSTVSQSRSCWQGLTSPQCAPLEQDCVRTCACVLLQVA